jgi:tetratricopeptide (TPR) repeat protein
MDVDPGAPLATAIRAAQAAARRGDVHGVDHAYARAAKISRIVAHDHCAGLLGLGAIAKAAQRCDEYLTADDTDLRILRAQIRSAATEHAEAARDVRELRKRDLSELQQAVLARVAALAAADRYDHPTAESELDAAERHFRRAHQPEHLEVIGNDRLLLDVRRSSRAPKITDQTARTPAEFLRRAAALRRDVRYDEALALMTRCVTSYEIEPALRFAVLCELAVLLVMTRQPGAARRLFPLLVAEAGPEVLSRLPDATRTLDPEPHLCHVRRLIAEDELAEAESLLGNGNSALWHLTAAELAYAAGRLGQAAGHFRQAAARANHAELKALALRKLGDTCADALDEDQAVRYWAASRHLDEDITDRRTALRLLHATPDEHDGRVLAAVRRVRRDGGKALAGLVVAVEAARGTSTTPRFTDLRAAARWLRSTTKHLPRNQVVWMMHATPDQLHHVIVGRRITHVRTDVHIADLAETIRQLKAWSPGDDPAILTSLLTELSGLIALEDVLGALPPKTTRIAVVAGDVLEGIPLAGLHLGRAYALSSLPCLSALPRPRRGLRKNGAPVPLGTRPTVYLSFAGKDRPHAEQLCAELEARNVTAQLDETGTTPGSVHDELATSDYYVLLWSANTPHRDWATAFIPEITRRRAFLFVVRLDEEPLPPLLAPRRHLDLVDAADRLVTTWRADRKSELPVFPQPVPPVPDGPTAAISVRSHDLGVTHVVTAPLHPTGAELYRTVTEALRLPAGQATFDGSTGMRFSYELLQQNKPIPADQSTVDLISDVVDIEVRVESSGPDDGLDLDQKRVLLVAAFRHLLP